MRSWKLISGGDHIAPEHLKIKRIVNQFKGFTHMTYAVCTTVFVWL